MKKLVNDLQPGDCILKADPPGGCLTVQFIFTMLDGGEVWIGVALTDGRIMQFEPKSTVTIEDRLVDKEN